MNTFILKTGREIPSLGYGTWKLKNDPETENVIAAAIKLGYRHIDTAKAYLNEETIGKGIKKSKIKRNEIFITGKLWNDDRGYENVINACKETIKKLDVEYLDLYLIHWPASPALYENWIDINNETWKAFETLYSEGLVKAIGVCNFNVRQLEKMIENCKVKPMVNQIEIHPGQLPTEIIKYCQKNKIIVEAWGPLGSGKMLKKQELINMAEKYNITTAQLCIKWCIQNDVLPICKSKNIDRISSNLDIWNFEISKEDMTYLNNLPYLGGSGLDSETLTLFN